MRRASLFLLLAALMGFGGCTLDLEASRGQVTPGEFHHRWAIDMAKVHNKVPKYAESPRFVASSVEQVLPNPQMAAQLGPAICEAERVIGEDGSVENGGCYVWGNMQTRNYDHSRHVDDPVNHPIVNVIDEQGNRIDPPGYLNIVALRRAERHQQQELRSTLRNGDILVYFHPEDDDTTQYQMHHAAMYYDTGSGPLAISMPGSGEPFVHHVDNPTSYGPAFNAGASSTPFHVFRFSPNGAAGTAGRDAEGRFEFPCSDEIRDASGPEECQAGAAKFTITDEAAEQYAYMARNWALIDNGHVPFADFHSLTWRDAGQRGRAGATFTQEVDRFATPILNGDEEGTPEVYCAGLVFTNLTLGMNRPLNERGLGALFPTFAGRTYSHDDGYMRYGEGTGIDALSAEDLGDPMNLPRLGTFPVEPIMASDIIDAWLDGYYGGRLHRESNGTRGLPTKARAQILVAAKQQLIGGFGSLRWDQAMKPGSLNAQSPVASERNLMVYANAYCGGCLGLPDAFFEQFSPENRERVREASTDMAKMKQLEQDFVQNRYVPPPLYHVVAQREDSLLTYVATVIHEDLLQCIDPAGCGASGTGATTFMQGGPDSSLYPHYTVPNGGRHTQRIFAVDSGPQKVGLGSWVSTRISAADIRDVQVVLHPAGSFPAFTGAEALYSCDRQADCLAGVAGVPVPVGATAAAAQTTWNDVNVRFELFKPVAEGGLGCLVEEDGRRTCPSTTEGERIDVTNAYGQWTLSVMDLGVATEGADIAACVACPTGGAHSNQWVLYLSDKDPSTGGGGPTLPSETEPNNDPAQANVLQTLPAQIAGELAEGGDRDLYTFTLATAGAVTILTDLAATDEVDDGQEEEEDEGPSGPDTYLELLGPEGGEPIAQDDDGAGVGTFSKIEQSLAAGTYVIVVRGYSEDITGAYTLRVTSAGTASE